MSISTPWGPSQYSKQFGRGIVFYGTSSHGGFKVCPTLNAAMPAHLRYDSGWYEEDSGWARVAVAFPERFPAKELADAKHTLKNWDPDAYEAHFGELIPAGESYIKDQRAFAAKHAQDLLVFAAWGSWHKQVPEGMVAVVASPGGIRSAPSSEKYFLVPESEYAQREQFGFVVNPTIHAACEKII